MPQSNATIIFSDCTFESDGIYCAAEIKQDDVQSAPLQEAVITIDSGHVYAVGTDWNNYCSYVGKDVDSCLQSFQKASLVFDPPDTLSGLSKTQQKWDEHAYSIVRVWLGYTFPEKEFAYDIYKSGKIEVYKPTNFFSHTLASITAANFILFSLNYYTGEFKDFHGHHFMVSLSGMRKMDNILDNACPGEYPAANICCVGIREWLKMKQD